MESLVEITAEAGPFGPRITRCTGRPPLTPRVTGDGEVHLVGTGGGPLPGDRVQVRIRVGPGASLILGAVAGTVAQRGADELAPTSVWHFDVEIAAGGTLRVPGAPLVAAGGCRHRVVAEVRLAPDANLEWSDLLVAGRTGEASGQLTSELRVRRGADLVLEQELTVGAAGADVLGGARCVGSRLVVGAGAATELQRIGPRAMAVPLAVGAASLTTALGDPADVARHLGA